MSPRRAAATELTGRQVAWWLLGIVLLGALVRGMYLLWPHMDSDIAVVGLMARHALNGEFVPLYWGNHYGGSLEPLIAAGVFSITGAGPRALNATAVLISLSYLPLVYLLGKEIIGRRAGLAAAFLAALGPYMLVAYSVVARGLHVEMLPLGALLLWLTVRLIKAGPTAPGQVWALMAWGLTAGVGVWTNPLFIYFLPPAMFLLIYSAPRLVITPRFWLMALAALVGAAPLIYHNWLTGGGTLHYMEIPRPHSGFVNNLHFLLRHGLPAVVGATWFKKGWLLPGLGPALALAAGLSLAWALWRWGGDLIKRLDGRGATGGEVLLITMGCVAYVFCAVGGADSGSFRYLLALYIIWPLVAALTWDSLRRRGGVLAGLAWLFLALVAVGSLWGTVAFSPLNHPEQRRASREMGPEQASLTRALKGLGIRYAYVVDYWLGMKGTFLANEQVIMLPFDHERHPPYKQALLRAPRYAVVMLGENNAKVTRQSLATVGASYQEKTVPPRWHVFYDFAPPDQQPAPVDTRAWSLREGAGMVLWDRDATTRLTWPQEPGTGPTLDLGGQVEGVCQVLIFPGRAQFLPKELRVLGSNDGQNWQELAKAQPYLPFHWSGGRLAINQRAPWQEIRFAPTTLRYLRLEQGGKAKDVWAINELMVGRVAAGGKPSPPVAAARLITKARPQGERVWAPPALRAWLPPELRAGPATRHKPPWLPPYLYALELMPSQEPLSLAVEAEMAPATAQALTRAGYQHSAQALKGWVLFGAEPGPLARPLYWTGLLPLAVSRGAGN
ncbi:MAG: glycosyltransferase family 39 protein [Desulfarculaceae bacterium]|nr:glycosyltransferase family 39 protein [Desulfarculaceae bacterium]MCF8048319.1 glycosyltransferase family 39 protein [Desulfarculaceae bacterium]MCF8098618.1 glycosyltransferase family 39 protein [Desulfarculaceae bacterium]MCF8121332.1 glycosyltransferase family 39 protein [Desulfarculaceae bacterium]